MGSKFDEAREVLTRSHIDDLKNLEKYKPLIDAFDKSHLFEVDWAEVSTMKVTPIGNPSGKELSIMLDEVLFYLELSPVREKLDDSDLVIGFGEWPNSYSMWVTIKKHTKCRIIEMSSKARIRTLYDKTYALVCSDEEVTNG